MGRYTSAGSGRDFKQAPPGSHAARCIGIIDLGTQAGEWQGKPNKQNKVLLRWELPFETDSFDGEEKPLIVSKFYTNSLSDKANLRHDLESWRTRKFTVQELMGFDLETIIGKTCSLSIVHNDAGKAKVVGVAALPKGMTCPPQYNPSLVFWIDPWDDNKFTMLPEYFQGLITESEEFKAFTGSRPSDDEFQQPRSDPQPDDDIPF